MMRVTLTTSRYEVLEARSGEDALENLRVEIPDLVLLDLNLPGMDGLETCREIRRVSIVPVIILSVRKEGKDKVGVLDAGADDYVTKPFAMEELLARIRACLRRARASKGSEPKRLVLDDLDIDFEKREVLKANGGVHLSPKEFELLRLLVGHADHPVSHRRLLQAVWGPDYGDELECLRVVVRQLRTKIETDPSRPRYLLTEPCVGYRFVLPSPDALTIS